MLSAWWWVSSGSLDVEGNEDFLKTPDEMQYNDFFNPFGALIDQNTIFSLFELNEDITLPIIDPDPGQDNYSVSGYNSEHNVPLSRESGCVSLYIKDTIEYTVHDNLWYQNDTMESLSKLARTSLKGDRTSIYCARWSLVSKWYHGQFIEIDKDQFKKKQIIIIWVIYRLLVTDIHGINDYILQCLDQIKAAKKLHAC